MKQEEMRMKFADKSSGFEITLPDNWRKLFIFERVKNNPFQGLLPRSLTEGPILINRDGDAMVILLYRVERHNVQDERRREQTRNFGTSTPPLSASSWGYVRLICSHTIALRARKPGFRPRLRVVEDTPVR